MKKGFTIIEIIISISIILIAGVSTTFFVLNNKNKKDIEKVTKEILKAANVYIKVEKDNNGKMYANEILNGKKGVAITIEQLVNKGYISEKDANIIYDNNARLEDNQDYYVMFINGGEGLDSYKEEYCEIGQIKILPSWVEKSDTPIYLCDNIKKEMNILISNQEMKELLKFSYNLIPVSESKYIEIKTFFPNEINNFTKDENGLFTYFNTSTGYLYTFYRGVVNNNYLELGNINGKPILWRILWARDDGRMKIVLDETLPVMLQNNSNEKKSYEIGTTIYGISATIGDFGYFTAELLSTTNEYGYASYVYKILEKFNNIFDATNDATYDLSLNDWWNSTDLDNYKYIISENSYCSNKNYGWNNTETVKNYYPSNNFDCYSDNSENKKKYQTIGEYNSGKLGYLSYGDIYMAGITENIVSGISNIYSENYLYESVSYLLSDMEYLKESEGSYGEINNIKRRYVVDGRLSYDALWVEKRDSCNVPYTEFAAYKVLSVDGEVYIPEKYNNCSGGLIIEKSYFNAQLKPTMTIDTTNIRFSDTSGTKDNPYTIIEN